MQARVEITYDDECAEVHVFDSAPEAIEFLRLCDAKQQSEEADRILGRSRAGGRRLRDIKIMA